MSQRVAASDVPPVAGLSEVNHGEEASPRAKPWGDAALSLGTPCRGRHVGFRHRLVPETIVYSRPPVAVAESDDR